MVASDVDLLWVRAISDVAIISARELSHLARFDKRDSLGVVDSDISVHDVVPIERSSMDVMDVSYGKLFVILRRDADVRMLDSERLAFEGSHRLFVEHLVCFAVDIDVSVFAFGYAVKLALEISLLACPR